MQELQRTLEELEREEREMAAERLSGKTKGLPSHPPQSNFHAGSTQQNQQVCKWLIPISTDNIVNVQVFKKC